MQQGEHEIISDDGLMQLYFTQVDASNELLPAHWHEHLEMICMQHGAMTAYINETSYELQQGDILVVNPRDIHYTHVHGDGHYYLLQIPPEHLKRVSEDWRGLHFGEYVPYSEETASVNCRMSQKLEEMKCLQEQAADGTHLLFLAAVYKLLYLLYTKDAATVDHVLRHRSRRDFERIEQSMQYVKRNYTNPITLKETADELSLTPEYFCRLFKKYTGQTFLTYVNQIRLQYFHSDLLQTDEIGMGKRTNTILQSAFFKLANVMPIDQAVEFMKAAAKKSYGKKGDAVVEMNYKAIDAGVDAVHKVEVPASWKNPEADAAPAELKGLPKTVKMVRDLMEPISLMDGDSLPVSAFKENPDGQFELGAAAYEKRGTAVTVPTWNAEKCIQCNQCAFVCSHATIRPFMLSEDEVKAAPSNIKLADTKPKASEYKYTMSVSPLDCMGCGECITVCPVGAIEMVPQESQAEEQPVFDYLVANVGKKPGMPADNTVKGSQFNQPLLEFSGSCAGCAETSYARLITQLFGEHMYISNATGCSSIWGGPAATSPYTVNKDSKKGPAWANSLFEDNAEHGLGMEIGQKVLREQAIASAEKCATSDKASAELKAAFDKFVETKNDTKANTPAAAALVAELEKAAAAGCPDAKAAVEKKDYLAKKSVWIFGGDGWAYDIGFGGLDHVLASGENVNVMVFDTEMYSNTGGQASKASNIGEVCQFAASGKEVGKKSLAEIAMSYGYVYVAQIALGANMAQAVKVIAEAEAYNGPSLIIGYAPCELHGVKGGMNHCQDEMKKAVAAGYWNLFSFNPQLKAEGKNPFTLTSKPGDGSYQDFLNNETRYSRLTRAFPERAERLFKASEEAAKARYEHLQRLVELYK